jgi:TPR repeat protein
MAMEGSRIILFFTACLLLTGCPGDQTERAAQAGDATAQFALALRLENSDPAEFRRLLLLASAKGNVAAQFHLGKHILTQTGGRKDDAEKGFYWVSKAAAAGHKPAVQFLPLCHLRGLGTKLDPLQAAASLTLPLGELKPADCLELAKVMDFKTHAEMRAAVLEKGVSNGSTECSVLLVKQLATGADAGKHSIRIRELLENAVKEKHPEATLILGYRMLNGIGMPPKPNKGIELISQAAEMGSHDAACELFWPLVNGQYVGKDPGRAFKLVQKAQSALFPRAYGLMARCYMYGIGTKKNEHLAVDMLRRGATHDDTDCLEWLGNIFLGGEHGQQRSLAEALRYLDRATKKGSVDAFQNLYEVHKEMGDNKAALTALETGATLGNTVCRVYLGMAHGYGSLGLAVDEKEALTHYLVAADDGDRYAMYLAGELLVLGKNVAKDLNKGVPLLKSAAANNVYAAQHLLAVLYSRGQGVPQDAGQAYFWANIAASLNADDEKYSRFRDTLAKKLDTTELTKVQGQCRTWLSRKTNEESGKGESSAGGGSGSGIIFTADGLVLTNHHVTAAGSSYTIVTSDGQEIPATLVAHDADLDVAVLRLKSRFHSATFKTPPPLASSSKAKSGEKVFTVGHPLAGLLSSEAKYNEGTISALSGMKDDLHLMQISVPIQPGNSGGPLSNTRGEVIGLIVSTINGSALLRQRDIMAQNINFAIKSDPVHDFLKANSIAVSSYPSPTDPVEHVKAYAVKVLVHP